MGVKCNHHGLAIHLISQPAHLLEDGLMAEVHTVEGANGDHGIFDVTGLYAIVDDSHKMFSMTYLAICTALVAAPLRMLSLTTQRFNPFSMLKSLRILPTNTSFLS